MTQLLPDLLHPIEDNTIHYRIGRGTEVKKKKLSVRKYNVLYCTVVYRSLHNNVMEMQ